MKLKGSPMSNRVVDLVIVDDDPIIGKVLLKMLRDYDLNVHFYDDSVVALEQIIIDRPRLVILDYNMPQLDGKDLIVKFSEKLMFQTTSVMLFTAQHLCELETMKLMTLGFEKIITKPVTKNDFVEIISNHLGGLNLKVA